MLPIVRLNSNFYSDFASCKEILQKQERPYSQLQITLWDYIFFVPFRSNISHKYVFWTDKKNRCGLDFTKTVVFDDLNYVDTSASVLIRENEFDALRGNDFVIAEKLRRYIKVYQKARNNQFIQRNALLCSMSSLQYFDSAIMNLLEEDSGGDEK